MAINRSAIAAVILMVASLMQIQMASSAIMRLQVPEYLNTTDIPLPKLFRCYCNLPECLTSNKENNNTCITRQGCFSELQPIMPDVLIYDNCTSDNTSTTQCFTTTTPTVTTQSPVPEHDTDETAKFVLSNHNMDGSYGCLEFIPTNKTCDGVLGNIDYNDSEFPRLQQSEINSTNDVKRAYQCCQDDMCNDRLKVADTAKAIQNAVLKTFTNSNNTFQTIQEELLTNSQLPQWSPIITMPDNISATNDLLHLSNPNIFTDIPSNYPASLNPIVFTADNNINNNTNMINNNTASKTQTTQEDLPTNLVFLHHPDLLKTENIKDTTLIPQLFSSIPENASITDTPIDALNHPSLFTEQIMSTTDAMLNNNITKLIANNITEAIMLESPTTQEELQAHLVFEQAESSLKRETINSSTNILEHLLMTASLGHNAEVNNKNSNEDQEIIKSVPLPIPAALKSLDDEFIKGNLNIINKSATVETLMPETDITRIL